MTQLDATFLRIFKEVNSQKLIETTIQTHLSPVANSTGLFLCMDAGERKADMALERNGHTPDYVVCKCSRKSIKLNLPIAVTPEGRELACIVCFAPIDECQPAQREQVIEVGLPMG